MAINLGLSAEERTEAQVNSGEPFIRGKGVEEGRGEKIDKKFAALFWILAASLPPSLPISHPPFAPKNNGRTRIMKNCWSTIARNTAAHNRIMSLPGLFYPRDGERGEPGVRREGAYSRDAGKHEGETHYGRAFTDVGDLVITYCEFIYQIVG